MYEISGAFGQVRHIRIPLNTQNQQNIPTGEVPFHFNGGGWHQCNDLYRISREQGKSGHLLFFSLNDGGAFELLDKPPVQIPAASIVWIPQWCKHAYYTCPNKLWEFYWLDVAENPILRWSELFDENSMLSFSDIDVIFAEIESLFRYQNLSTYEFQIESSRIIGNIYHMLLRKKTSRQIKSTKDELIQDMIRNMESNCALDWNLSDLSKQYFISVPQLIRRFKTYTGRTPHDYLIYFRLQESVLHLKYTNLSINEIAQKNGFSSTSNFIQHFRRYFGVTPSAYRQEQ